MYSHFEQEEEARLKTEPLASFSKKETMISKRAFKDTLEKLPQSK